MITKHLSILILFIAFLTSCDNQPEHKEHNKPSQKRVYTCPMHPQIIRDVPGQCPICGMNLVEKKNEGSAIKNDTLAILLKPANQFVISQVKTIRPQFKEIPIELASLVSYPILPVASTSIGISLN